MSASYRSLTVAASMRRPGRVKYHTDFWSWRPQRPLPTNGRQADAHDFPSRKGFVSAKPGRVERGKSDAPFPSFADLTLPPERPASIRTLLGASRSGASWGPHF